MIKNKDRLLWSFSIFYYIIISLFSTTIYSYFGLIADFETPYYFSLTDLFLYWWIPIILFTLLVIYNLIKKKEIILYILIIIMLFCNVIWVYYNLHHDKVIDWGY